MDYDRNIHHNPDADAWAKFFVETTKDMDRGVFNDVAYMRAWFANAMMAMHDSMKPHEPADEIKRLRGALRTINGLIPKTKEIIAFPHWVAIAGDIAEGALNGTWPAYGVMPAPAKEKE